MRKFTAYQTILCSRSMYLFPKQAHRTICVNLTAKCEQKTRYFPCLFDETDYCSDSCNRVKGRQKYSLLNVFVRSKRLQFSQLLIETNCSIRWIHSYQCSTLRLIECFHMTSRRPYWCPKTMKRRPCWCPKPILWGLNSFLMQTLYFVSINLHRCWPRE